MSELGQLLGHELRKETYARFDHAVWCGDRPPYEECAKLAEHRAEGEIVASKAAANAQD